MVGGITSVGRSKARVYDIGDRPSTRFGDVAGYAGAKQEVAEVVDFLKHPDKYKRAGAIGPRGVLMVGPPGTGQNVVGSSRGRRGRGAFPGPDRVELCRDVCRRRRRPGTGLVRRRPQEGPGHHLHRRGRCHRRPPGQFRAGHGTSVHATKSARPDLANTNLLSSVINAGLALLGPQAPRLDPKVMVAEIHDRVMDELDYRIEAANQEEFHSLYDGHPFIHIPAVHPEFSTGRVLVTDYVHGERWSATTAADQATRSRWGEAIFRFVFANLHHHGLFNADPHPGNYLFHGDGTVTFLDFGCVKRFTAERAAAISALVDAALACDAARPPAGLHQCRAARRRRRRGAGRNGCSSSTVPPCGTAGALSLSRTRQSGWRRS